jgi:hypothetical protein
MAAVVPRQWWLGPVASPAREVAVLAVLVELESVEPEWALRVRRKSVARRAREGSLAER